MSLFRTPYFINHDRRERFPWSLYHRPLQVGFRRIIGAAKERLRRTPRVLVVGCGLEPIFPGVDAIFYGCDIDPYAIEACRKRYPGMAERLAICPHPYALPEEEAFRNPFDVVLAKEVIEHVEDPERWARLLAERVAPRGSLALSTPNYGPESTLGLIERTALEWIARFDGYSRRHIHLSKFDRKRLASLDLGPEMELIEIDIPWTRWTLLGHWRRLGPST
ncbi:MAG: methyltransferase domain-containing protein [Sandaracinaceae bacterium]|nr:methyltransferase domain-containing protein [Sandaracinaceae bacterium]